MSYDEQLAGRVREALADHPEPEELAMFGGLCFMVDGKMCICVNADGLLCRIGDKAVAVEQPRCRHMMSGRRMMKHFVYVAAEILRKKSQLDEWIDRCIAFNKKARPSKTKKSGSVDKPG